MVHQLHTRVLKVFLILTMLNVADCFNMKVRPMKSKVGKKEKVGVVLQYENNGPEPVYIRPLFFPDGGLLEPIFSVTRDGTPMKYLGRVAKMQPDTISRCIKVDPGKNITRNVDISNDYVFKQDGVYTISLDADAKTVLLPITQRSASAAQQASVSNTKSDAVISIEGRPEPPIPAPTGSLNMTASRRLGGYRSCSLVQQLQIRNAFNVANIYADNAVNYFKSTPPGNHPRYVTWFGAYDASRWKKAASNFQTIAQSLKNHRYVIDCTCKNPDIFAYVYPSSPYSIYVCGVFWKSNTGGADSKAGTIIHEASHFTSLVGTNDHVYGQSACKRLATKSPDKTLMNADTHEYFVENTPAL